MYLKLVGNLQGEPDKHIIEGDHFHWGWRKEWPDKYYQPFAIGDGPDKLGTTSVMVVDVFKTDRRLGATVLVKSIVVFQAVGYIMNDTGQTIDKFAA